MPTPGADTFPGAFPGATGDAPAGGWVFATPTVNVRAPLLSARGTRTFGSTPVGHSVYRIGGVWHTSFGPGPDLVSAADRFYGGGRLHLLTDAQVAELIDGGFGSYLHPLTATVGTFPGAVVYPALLLFPSD